MSKNGMDPFRGHHTGPMLTRFFNDAYTTYKLNGSRLKSLVLSVPCLAIDSIQKALIHDSFPSHIA